MKDQQEAILSALIEALTQHQQQKKQSSNGALPVPYQGDMVPSSDRPGFFTRLFDPHAAIKAEFERKQYKLVLDTRIKAMEYEAKSYAETIRIDHEHKVRLHEHEVVEKEVVLKKYAEARAQILLHSLQQGLMSQVADLHLDPTDEQYLIAKIVGICMQNGKEQTNGRK